MPPTPVCCASRIGVVPIRSDLKEAGRIEWFPRGNFKLFVAANPVHWAFLILGRPSMLTHTLKPFVATFGQRHLLA